MKRSFLALTAVLVAFGCTEAPTEPELTPSFSFINGPASPGVVARELVSGPFLLVASDDGSLVALGGLGALEPSQSFVCVSDADPPPIAFQDIFTPSGALVSQSHPNLTWHVWDGAEFFSVFFAPPFNPDDSDSKPDFCGAVSLDRLAEGFGSLDTFDNDALGSGTRTHTFGFMGRGVLDDIGNDGTTRLSVRFVLQVGKKGFRPIMEKVTLR